jgi:hypothetical protein
MKKFLLVVLISVVGINSFAQQAFYDVIAANGNGIRFWQDDRWKIHMGNAAEYHYGPVTDYSIKMNMDATAGRGWTWGVGGQTPIAAINTSGSMQIAGTFTATGNMVTNNLLFGKYGSSLDGSTDPFILASLAGGNQDLIVYGDSGPNTLNLRLHDGALKMGNSSTPNAVINNDGSAYFINSVGIGTTAPGGKLHVQGSTYIGNENGDASYRVSVGASGGDYGSLGYGYKYGLTSGSHSYAVGDYASQLKFENGGFSFFTAPIGSVGGAVNFSRAMTILQNGYVGIGTPSPTYKFHVSAADASVQQRFQRTGSSTGITDVGVDDQGFKFWVGGYSATSLKVLYGSNGNVGIGTFSPDATLTVNGNIHSKEVKVDLNIPGPDYVFEKDYKLTSLEEIKNYIDQNKHLPEVPSAKEMEKNGVQLGEMNMLLLRKIEELTLHLIEQNKMMAELKERSVSPDPSGKKIEELTLYVIELKKRDEVQQREIELLKSK